MTALNGLVGIVFNLTAIVASTSSSSMRPVLIHQFDDHRHNCHPVLPLCPLALLGSSCRVWLALLYGNDAALNAEHAVRDQVRPLEVEEEAVFFFLPEHWLGSFSQRSFQAQSDPVIDVFREPTRGAGEGIAAAGC
jgi:hypothetical protein